ncbi:Cloroperoxidase [Aureobasidium pullulans]|nr:Cloroperoxidase [Aureobasidium pullulans]THZ21415.1 Cloroperoxidase [Aureobasidium pullulans]
MYLGLWDCLKGLLTFNASRTDVNGLINSKGGDHYYTRGNIADRGPCPGLNALANQGYLPRDGKNITLPQVEEALRISLHMEKSLASSITRPLRPLLRKDGTFDLVLMRQHNVIEHDASFTRLDFREGDNYNLQPRLFRAMLDDAGNGPITISSLAKTYIRRNKESRAAAKMGGKLDREVLRAFYEEERFPEVILENGEERTLVGLVGFAVALLFCVVFRV